MSKKKGLKRGSQEWKHQQDAKRLIQEETDVINRHVVRQMAMDAAVLVLNEEFGFGAERIKRFHDAWEKQMRELADFFEEDHKADPTYVYAKAKLDEAMLRIVGEKNFCPWNKRYLPNGFEVVDE